MGNKSSRKRPKFIKWFWSFFMMAGIMTSTIGLKTNSNLSNYNVATGENISHGCQFTPVPFHMGALLIEWIFSPAGGLMAENIISFLNDTTGHRNMCFQIRIHFSSLNPRDTDASLTLSDLRITNSGIYKLKVRNPSRLQTKKVYLTIMEKISKPLCGLSNDFEVGRDLKLKCRILPGSHLWISKWEKMSEHLPHSTKFGFHGYLYIKNITEIDLRTFQCAAKNNIGRSQKNCELLLSYPYKKDNTVRTVGINQFTAMGIGIRPIPKTEAFSPSKAGTAVSNLTTIKGQWLNQIHEPEYGISLSQKMGGRKVSRLIKVNKESDFPQPEPKMSLPLNTTRTTDGTQNTVKVGGSSHHFRSTSALMAVALFCPAMVIVAIITDTAVFCCCKKKQENQFMTVGRPPHKSEQMRAHHNSQINKKAMGDAKVEKISVKLNQRELSFIGDFKGVHISKEMYV
uniref:Immunoglobulin V-set domain-containing protein n=1 Tax=Cynoglossus semilaevis TaxID=244447 RepID=A0A3P8UI33_CYNSE